MNTNTHGSISNFDEEYRYWREAGLSHFEALNKARDYYRKFLRREIAESDTMSLDQFEYEESVSLDQMVDFNNMIDKLLNVEYGRDKQSTYGKKDKILKLICLLVRMEGLDHLLSEENLGRSYDMIGDIQVGSMAEIAIAMGYKVKANGCSNTLTELKYGLQNLMRDCGMVVQEGSRVSFS